MSELELTRDERLRLRGRAHHLHPVVLLGAAGLSEAVLKEADRALTAHELIKVRIPGDDRDEREAISAAMADRLGAARVQSIGKLLVLFRPRPEPEAAAVGPASAAVQRAPRPAPAARPPAPRAFAARSANRAVPRRGGGRGR